MNDSKKDTRLGYLSGKDLNLYCCSEAISYYLQTHGEWLDTYVEVEDVRFDYRGHGDFRQYEVINSYLAPTIAIGLNANIEMWRDEDSLEEYLERAWANLGFKELELNFVDDSTLLHIGIINQLIEEDALALAMGIEDREFGLKVLAKASARATEKCVVTKELIVAAMESLKHE